MVLLASVALAAQKIICHLMRLGNGKQTFIKRPGKRKVGQETNGDLVTNIIKYFFGKVTSLLPYSLGISIVFFFWLGMTFFVVAILVSGASWIGLVIQGNIDGHL